MLHRHKLTPNAQGKFTETILYRFQGFADGAEPEDDRLVIDASENIFGTTAEGGNSTACPADGFGTPGGVASCSRLPRKLEREEIWRESQGSRRIIMSLTNPL
ncbi:MAG: hypothetical protein WB711_15305 [Terriglobales bacterium]